ncbi:MAG: Gfo/Idh/MocA family oxidoreductase [Oscillospiraceae bacterium]|jgi:predicted dehydrogenase|nr:Gfo/Idh/MocA family oxidoreductase [Oscillospiraceae bacterium]
MKPMRFGLVGYKFMGKAHANALSRLPMFFETDARVERSVLCGRDARWLEQAAQTLGFGKTETDWRKLVAREDVDAIDITAPSNAHKEIALAAIKEGKHVFCEKPLALTADDAREMREAADKAGVANQVGFNYRFAPAMALAKRIIDEGKIGKVFHFRGSFLQDWIIDPEFPKVWRLDKSVCGSGSLGDLGAHVIDAARYLLGDIAEVVGDQITFVKERPVVERMTGLSGKADANAPRAIVDVDDATSFIARFENGAMGLFEATRFAQGHKNDFRLEINGEKGSLRFEFERMNELWYFNAGDEPGEQGWRMIQVSEGVHPYWDKWWPAGHVIGFPETFVHELYEFAQCAAQGRPCSPSFADGEAVARIMDAVELSSQRRAWVSVGEI